MNSWEAHILDGDMKAFIASHCVSLKINRENRLYELTLEFDHLFVDSMFDILECFGKNKIIFQRGNVKYETKKIISIESDEAKTIIKYQVCLKK